MTSGLWRDRAFLTYWCAAAIDGLGGPVTFMAMPLVAVVTLQATADRRALDRGRGGARRTTMTAG